MHQLTGATTPERLFARLVASEPGRPFVTYYDEATGERSELSRRSLANWVAKTHFLLVDELGLGVGDTALVALPAHWISVPAVLGCLTAGLTLTADGPADVAFVAPDRIPDGVADVYAVASDKAALGFGGNVPSGTSDYVASVRPQPDTWTAVQLPAEPATPCWPGVSRADAVSRAVQRASALGAAADARLLSTRDWAGIDDIVDTVLVPLATGGSVVFVRNAADESVIERRIAQERATVRL